MKSLSKSKNARLSLDVFKEKQLGNQNVPVNQKGGIVWTITTVVLLAGCASVKPLLSGDYGGCDNQCH